MDIIPVIDLMGGLAVHARLGRRETYRPLVSRLCQSPQPRDVVAGLLRLHPFRRLYVADLDAILGEAPQDQVLRDLGEEFPDLELWVDRGHPGEPPWPGAVPVWGSESLAGPSLANPQGFAAGFVLSLDFRDGRLLGPEMLLHRPQWWPERVILMNLGRVGGSAGPDFDQAERFRGEHPRHQWVAAGGVRGLADLERLDALGMAAVLVASALHSGAVDAAHVRRFG